MTSRLAINGGRPAIPAGSHRRWPDVRSEDKTAVLEALDGELWGDSGLPQVRALAEEWASYVGTRYCVPVNSGTAALHCGIVAAGVRPGEEVIVPAFSFVASAMAVLHNGAVPVFCDIRPDSYNIDPRQIERLVTERTRAIMPVHIHGLPADMDELGTIARRHNLRLIEDAAQAHGAHYRGRIVGSLGFAAGFSLNAAKNLSAIEGGLFVTNDEDAYLTARRLIVFGEDTPALHPGEFRAFWSQGVGWNYKMPEIIAALARSQLKRLDHYNQTAQRNAKLLSEGLAQIAVFEPPLVPADRTSIYHRYRVRLKPRDVRFQGNPVEFRDRIWAAIRAEGIPCSIWQFVPLPAQPVFRRPAPVGPWTSATNDQLLKPWDPSQYPVTTELLENSIVLGPEAEPLYVQPAELMEQYLYAMAKVVDNIDEVLSAKYVPPAARPSIPLGSAATVTPPS